MPDPLVTSILQRDIRVSLLGLAGVITFACIGLALDGSWPKRLRVSMAFGATHRLALARWRALAGNPLSST